MADQDLPLRMAVVTRDDARAMGLIKYFTGIPCIHGHISQRYMDGHCVFCIYNKGTGRKDYYSTWRQNNLEKCAAYTAQYRKKNPHVGAEYMRRMRTEKRDELLAAERIRYAANPEKFAKKCQAYRNKNPQIYAMHARNRRSINKGAAGSHSTSDIQSLMKRQNARCVYCFQNIKKKYHVDHIQPLSKGGSNWPENLQLTCVTCNLKKKNIDPIKFAQRIGRLL
jgi:5-methylcytosine-specific restriction endonuclease McrA